MKRGQRHYTSCDLCRIRKRGCDLMNSDKTQCSQCSIRNITCKMNGRDVAEWKSSLVGHLVTQPKQGESSKLSALTDSSPLSPTSSLLTRLPPEFLTSCIVKHFSYPEWGYFVDQSSVLNAVLKVQRKDLSDVESLSLLYVLTADVVIKVGISQVPKVFAGASRFSIANELFNLHLRLAKMCHVKKPETLQATIFRAYFYVALDQIDEAWNALHEAVSYLRLQNRDSKEYANCYVITSILESSLCSFVGIPAVFIDALGCTTNRHMSADAQRRLECAKAWSKVDIMTRSPLESLKANQQILALRNMAARYQLEDKRKSVFADIYVSSMLLKLQSFCIDDPETFQAWLFLQDAEFFILGVDRLKASAGKFTFGAFPGLSAPIFQGLICAWVIGVHLMAVSSQNQERLEKLRFNIKEFIAGIPDFCCCKRITTMTRAVKSCMEGKVGSSQDGFLSIPAAVGVRIPADIQYANVKKESGDKLEMYEPFDQGQFWLDLSQLTDIDFSAELPSGDDIVEGFRLN